MRLLTHRFFTGGVCSYYLQQKYRSKDKYVINVEKQIEICLNRKQNLPHVLP